MPRLTYGPFSVRVDLVAGALAGLLGGPLLLGAGARTTYIACERGAATGTALVNATVEARICMCTVHTWPFGSDSERFAGTAAYATYVRRVGRGRPYEVGAVVVLDPAGKRHASIEVDHAEAEKRVAELDQFLGDKAAPSIAMLVHGPWWLPFLGLVAGWFGVATARAAWRGSGRVHLVPSDDRRTLTVRRSFFGVPLSTRELDIGGATGVEIEWGAMPEPDRRRVLVESGGRVVLRTPHGRVPILPTFARGRAVHFRAADELRQILGLPGIGDGSDEKAAPAPRASYDWGSLSGRFAACWAGACIGSLAGITLGVVGALTVGGAHLTDSAGGPWYFGGALLGVTAGIAVALHLTSRARLTR